MTVAFASYKCERIVLHPPQMLYLSYHNTIHRKYPEPQCSHSIAIVPPYDSHHCRCPVHILTRSSSSYRQLDPLGYLVQAYFAPAETPFEEDTLPPVQVLAVAEPCQARQVVLEGKPPRQALLLLVAAAAVAAERSTLWDRLEDLEQATLALSQVVVVHRRRCCTRHSLRHYTRLFLPAGGASPRAQLAICVLELL